LRALRSGDRLHPPILNPAFYTEWGGPSLVRYSCTHFLVEAAKSTCLTINLSKAATYWNWFDKYVAGADPVPVAGGNYFTISNTSEFWNEGLTHGPSFSPPYAATAIGLQYLSRYVTPYR
jgi:hypothetical protein